MLHPFMPFITEEIYHQLKQRKEGDDLTIRQQLPISKWQLAVLEQANLLKEVITALRDTRNKQQLKPKEEIKLFIQSGKEANYNNILPILSKQVNAATVVFVKEPVANAISVVIGKDKFYLQTDQVIDTGSQKDQLQKDLDYLKGFLISVEKKLGNEKFVQNAKPEVIETERKKKADAEEKIKVIEESLAAL